MTTPTVRRIVGLNLLIASLTLLAVASCRSAPTTSKESAGRHIRKGPSAARSGPAEELRGLFVTTSNNTDWPSQAGLDERIQQNEIDAVIIRAKELNCNVIFLQVRAWGDRMYSRTKLPFPEPWAQTLSFGNEPKYDPLLLWIRTAHRSGIQLHAWIEPYRTEKPIQYAKDKYLPFFASADGHHLYLDPTSIETQNHLLRVIDDLLSLYPPKDAPTHVTKAAATQPADDDGLDGIVVPHNIPNPANLGYMVGGTFGDVIAKRLGKAPPPAATTKTRKPPTERVAFLIKKHNMPTPYKAKNDPGASAEDFVREAYKLVDSHKRKFGLSPSEDQWDDPHANFKRWLEQRWCHYFIPELYLPPKEFEAGLAVWIKVNQKGGEEGMPLLAPAINTAAVERPDRYGRIWDPWEIEAEIGIARDQGVGQVHFSERGLRSHAQGGPPTTQNNVGDKVRKKYPDRALLPPIVPPNERVEPPGFKLTPGRIHLEGKAFQWLVRFRSSTAGWGEQFIVDHNENPLARPRDADRIEAIARDRHGNESDPAERSLDE